jgi:hypothetical protein
MLNIPTWQHISPEGPVKVVYSYNEPTVTLFNAQMCIKLIVKDFKKWYLSNAVDET